MLISKEKFWAQYKTPKHRGGNISTKRPPLPKPKKIRANKPGMYWAEDSNTFFVVHVDGFVETINMSGPLSDWSGYNSGWNRNSDYDVYLGPL